MFPISYPKIAIKGLRVIWLATDDSHRPPPPLDPRMHRNLIRMWSTKNEWKATVRFISFNRYLDDSPNEITVHHVYHGKRKVIYWASSPCIGHKLLIWNSIYTGLYNGKGDPRDFLIHWIKCGVSVTWLWVVVVAF